jgi:hypothetical protein
MLRASSGAGVTHVLVADDAVEPPEARLTVAVMVIDSPLLGVGSVSVVLHCPFAPVVQLFGL